MFSLSFSPLKCNTHTFSLTHTYTHTFKTWFTCISEFCPGRKSKYTDQYDLLYNTLLWWLLWDLLSFWFTLCETPSSLSFCYNYFKAFFQTSRLLFCHHQIFQVRLKIYPESDNITPFSLLLSWYKPPSTLSKIILSILPSSILVFLQSVLHRKGKVNF